MTSGKGLRQDELKGPESTSKPTLPWLWLLSLPGTVCPVPIIPVISPPFLSHPTPFFLLLLLFPLPCSPWPSPTLTWMDRGLGGMERGWEEETQCREVGGIGSQLLFAVSREGHGKSAPWDMGAWEH